MIGADRANVWFCGTADSLEMTMTERWMRWPITTSHSSTVPLGTVVPQVDRMTGGRAGKGAGLVLCHACCSPAPSSKAACRGPRDPPDRLLYKDAALDSVCLRRHGGYLKYRVLQLAFKPPSHTTVALDFLESG